MQTSQSLDKQFITNCMANFVPVILEHPVDMLTLMTSVQLMYKFKNKKYNLKWLLQSFKLKSYVT